MLKPELRELQEKYDVHMEETTLKQARAKRELEHKLAEEEYESLKIIVAKAHQLHKEGKATKMELREALRQYGSPKFTELWNIIPYDTPVQKVKTYHIDGDKITFYRTGWDWTNIDADELTFDIIVSENTGSKVLSWDEGMNDHVRFTIQNDTSEVINGG